MVKKLCFLDIIKFNIQLRVKVSIIHYSALDLVLPEYDLPSISLLIKITNKLHIKTMQMEKIRS